MQLSKLPCLDKGHVALIKCSLSKKEALSIELENKLQLDFSKELVRSSHFTFLIKAPISVVLYFANFDLHLTQLRSTEDIETYCPTSLEVAADDLETSEAISDDIKRTSEALKINPRAYMTDGCNPDVASCILPISTYVTCIIAGYHPSWKKMCEHSENKNHALIKHFSCKIRDILECEWPT